jgi:hypothetical protein
VAVSAGGCAEKAAVYKSSGVPCLHEAGLNWVLSAGRFGPAATDQKPVAAPLLFRLVFRLGELARAA